jgi:hypothetical protein
MSAPYDSSHAEKSNSPVAKDSSDILDPDGNVYETSDSRRQIGLVSAIFLYVDSYYLNSVNLTGNSQQHF